MDQVVAAARQHQLAGRAEQALQLLRRALQSEPGRYDANHLMGILLLEMSQVEQAEYYLRRALAQRPDDPELHNTLGMILVAAGKPADAAAAWERSLALREDFLPALINLARCRSMSGDSARAEECWRRGAALAPDDPGVLAGLCESLVAARRGGDAVDLMRAAATRNPQSKPILLGLVRALYFVADSDIHEMEDACRRAQALDPDDPAPALELAALLVKTGRANEAAALLRPIARRYPSRTDVLDSLANTLNYADDAREEEIVDVHRSYGRALAAQVRPLKPPANTREPERPLRVAYLSPDLRGHSVASYLEPLLRHHDRSAFRVHCYSGTIAPDETTRRLKAYDLVWREVLGLTDAALAQAIRGDGIDILVELSGHAGGARLAVPAMRPAPVQATFIGYPNTTGVPAIGYRLVDAVTDPPELGADARATERLARIPGCFLCYQPPPAEDDPGPAPRDPAAPLTFGSFNNIAKVGPRTARLWARILEAVPASRLVLKAINLGPGSTRRLMHERLAAQGIDPARVELRAGNARRRDHLAEYHGIDIALDPFPYHGTTTTCEALWMGAPVVVLAGRLHASRVGVSLLTAAGLPELIAADEDAYVAVASALAADKPRLAALRTGLRDRLAASPLCDAPGYARRVEGVLRAMWRQWCAAR